MAFPVERFEMLILRDVAILIDGTMESRNCDEFLHGIVDLFKSQCLLQFNSTI